MADWPYNTTQWKRLRKAHLSQFPFCEDHLAADKLVVANTVDHRKPISDGGHPFPGHDGLASYCPACHSAKTARGVEAGAVRTNKPRRGCSADGTPLDPLHPWNTAGDVSQNETENRSELPKKDHRRQNQIVSFESGAGVPKSETAEGAPWD